MATKTKPVTKPVTQLAPPVKPKQLFTKIPRDAVIRTGSPSVKMLGARVPKLVLSNLAKNKQDALIRACDIEIGWLGYVEAEKDGTLYVSDIFVPKQEISGVTTDIDEEWLGQFGMRLAETDEGCEKLTQMFYWGHSHVRMDTGPSGTDDKTMEHLGANCPMFIRGIFNKRGESNIAIADYGTGILYLDQPLAVRSDSVINSWAESAITNFCSEKTYASASYSNQYGEYIEVNGIRTWVRHSDKEVPPPPAKEEEEEVEGSPEAVLRDLWIAVEIALDDSYGKDIPVVEFIMAVMQNSSYEVSYTEVSNFVKTNLEDINDTASYFSAKVCPLQGK